MKIRLGLLNIFLLLTLVACTTDISKRRPYVEAIGKQFVLQQDMYIYCFNDYGKYSWPVLYSCKFCIGTINQLGNFSYGLPREVEEKYIGSKNSWVTLNGILWKGTVITIKRIVEQKTLDNSYHLYIISPNQGSFADQEIDPFNIIRHVSNPPYTKTWGDPPIFDPKFALPLPSDGVWWK